MTSIEDKKQLLTELRKDFGEQSIFILDDLSKLNVEVRSSGSLMLDLALGGGYAHGRIVELSGKERAGKSTVACLAIANAQMTEPDKYCALIDTEHTFNQEWAEKLGVNVHNLFVSQPDTYAEKVYEMLERLVASNKFSVIVLDSVAGLISKEEFECEDWAKDGRVGGISKLNTKATRKIINSGLLRKSGTSLLFINQIRDKIGGFSMFGTPTDVPGGRALKFSYTHRLEVAAGEQFVKGNGENREVLGNQIKIKVIKNKIAPPFKTATVDLYYEYGMDRIMELVKVAKAINVLQGASWLKLVDLETGEVITNEKGEEMKWNGITKCVEVIREDVKSGGGLYDKIYDMVNNVLRGE